VIFTYLWPGRRRFYQVSVYCIQNLTTHGCISALGYSRPSASDFDDWKTEGWTAKDILPCQFFFSKLHQSIGVIFCLVMKKCETFEPWQDDPMHGYSGPLAVSYGGTKLKLGQQWLKAAESRGIPIRKDLQDLKTGFGSYWW